MAIAFALLLATSTGAAADDTDASQLPGATVASLHAWLIEHNPDLRAMTLDAQAAAARVQPAGALPDPMVQAELRDIDADKPRLLPAQVGSTFYQLRQRVPLWGKRGLARDAASADADAGAYKRDARLRELIADAERAYVRYWYAGQSAATLDHIVKLLDDLEQLAAQRYAAGLAPQQDAIKAQVERSSMQRERIERIAMQREAKAQLNASLARRPSEPLADPIREPSLELPANLDAAIAATFDTHPALAAEVATVRAAEQRRELAYRNRFPDITVGLAPIQVGKRLEGWELMVEVEIPFQQTTRRNLEREATLMRDAAEARREAAAVELAGQAGEVRASWEGAREQRALIEHTLLPQTDANFESALASYQVGAVDFTTLLDALRQRRAADLTRLDVARDMLLNAATLRSLIGATP
ncbi:TolC family protein [Tahibacter amnicola]|uniref:TolC family protein n=1 Tax=Tahibacter amnicola TaxID=2976241 RepID=A0ABY6B850_9GAMM|nr:TolC family protein [Tahibacter amnicola]UXI66060.1 TolC family protein [Tahibacter amnicola]